MSEFEDLIDAHYQALFRFGMSLTKAPDRAADLVQQTFCTWAEKGHQLKDRSKAKTWLFTTLHREFLSQIRRSKRYTEEGFDEAAAERIPAEDTADAERQMDGRRALELLHELAGKVPCLGKIPEVLHRRLSRSPCYRCLQLSLVVLE